MRIFGKFLCSGVLEPKQTSVNMVDKIDKFYNTEFFKDDFGLELSDVQVFVRASQNPEVQQKMRESMLEHEVAGFEPAISDDDVFKQLSSKYENEYTYLMRIKKRIAEIRALPPKVETKPAEEPAA